MLLIVLYLTQIFYFFIIDYKTIIQLYQIIFFSLIFYFLIRIDTSENLNEKFISLLFIRKISLFIVKYCYS